MPYHELNRSVSVESLEQRGVRALGPDFLGKRPPWVKGNISDYDSRFLAGVANFVNPQRVVEIGVASGWSSAVLLKAVESLSGDREVHGIDLSPTFYLEPTIPTGRAVHDAIPEREGHYRLTTGKLAFDAMSEIGKVDFAFIDGHHMHPWATLDMLSVLPFIDRGRWVAMHDLNLCTFERHMHKNRGPFYLFYMWPDQKIHSTQKPTMIGAVVLEREPVDYLPTLLEILYTPWEVDVRPEDLSRLSALIGKHFGEEWAAKFADAFNIARKRFHLTPDQTEQ